MFSSLSRRESELLIAGAQRGDQLRHIAESLQPPESFDRLEDTRGHPAEHHLPTAPAFDVPFHVPRAADQALGGIGRDQRPLQPVRQPQAHHRQRFFKPFAYAFSRTWILAVQSPREIVQKPPRRRHVAPRRSPENRLNPRALALRQVIQHIPRFVYLAALYQGGLPERRP